MTTLSPVRERLLDAALTAADDLAESAIVDGGDVRWEADVVTGIREGVAVLGHGDVGATLYDGSAGIALALAAAAHAAGRQASGPGPRSDEAVERLRSVAAGAAHTALAGIGTRTAPLGLFDGGTGVTLAALHVGCLLADAALVEHAAVAARGAAEALLGAVREPGADLEPDIIGGVAGDLLALLEVERLTAYGGAPAATLEAARFLRDAAQPQTWGSAWRTGGARPGGPPLLGFAHGAAGIVLALAEAAERADDATLRQAARDGMEFERSWYSPEAVNWPDLRESQKGGDDTWDAARSLRAWCHGALGIGLSRMRVAELTGEQVALAEVSAALQAARSEVVEAGTALRSGEARDATPCHGLAGAVEVFLVAGKAFDEPAHTRAAVRAADLLLAMRAAAGTWPCGLPGGGEVPGLMTGVAGVVVTLLRAGNAVTIPTPLLPGPCAW